MSMNYQLRVKLDKEQMEKIRQDAKLRGFRDVANYVRWFLLNKSTDTEEKINMMFQRIIGIPK
ncbi:MAG: hypothetical protein V1725_00850 [archaeon]